MFRYHFYDENGEILNTKYWSPDAYYESIEEIFSQDYLEYRCYVKMEEYGLYTLDELKNAIERVGKNFSTYEMLTCNVHTEDDLLRDIWQLSQIVSGRWNIIVFLSPKSLMSLSDIIRK